MGKSFKQKKKAPRIPGPCFHKDCAGRCVGKFYCRTCEALADQDKRSEERVFSIQACAAHRELALAKAKTHALVAHPYNILRVTAAALKGEL